MSASLVGSEMCIRDRCGQGAAAATSDARAPELRPRALARAPLVFFGGPLGSESVSTLELST
eukprot:153640-Alexandrium_andersonii.AAC.1